MLVGRVLQEVDTVSPHPLLLGEVLQYFVCASVCMCVGSVNGVCVCVGFVKCVRVCGWGFVNGVY